MRWKQLAFIKFIQRVSSMQRPNSILSFYLCVAVITLTRTQPLTLALMALFCTCVSLYLHALLAAGKVLCVRSAA